jgi:hypothetical protein
MPIQAFIDGSQTDHEVLVLAGYIANATAWDGFIVDWKAALNGPPKWSILKSGGAKRKLLIDPEFRRRYEEHYEIILRYAQASICVAIPLDSYNKVCDEFDIKRIDRNPYYVAFNTLLASYVGYSGSIGLDEKLYFIFDDQTEKVHVNNAWGQFYASLKRKYRERIGEEIKFKQDSKCLPLQAADLIAYWKREEYRALRDLAVSPLVPWKNAVASHGHLYAVLPEHGIREVVQRFAAKRYKMSISVPNVPYHPWWRLPMGWWE